MSQFQIPAKPFVTPAKELQVEHAPHVQGSFGERSDLQLVHHRHSKFRPQVMDFRLRGNDEVLV
jgi:hypothetical protein